MLHLRIVAPEARARTALRLLYRMPTVVNVIHLPGAARKPRGDVILADVAREDGSVVIGELKRLGLTRESCSIALEEVDTSISAMADDAERAAHGSPADAVVWESLTERIGESTSLSVSFLAFMVISTLIAATGILTDSQILIVGAMVVGPEFGPLAGLAVAITAGKPELARRSAAALAAGFALSILAAFAFTLFGDAVGLVDVDTQGISHPLTDFIARPNIFSVTTALLAGVAGTISLSTSKPAALVGVLISVTTIPAAANVGVAAAAGDWSQAAAALAQLLVNLVALTLAAVATLLVQRRGYRLRRSRELGGRVPAAATDVERVA